VSQGVVPAPGHGGQVAPQSHEALELPAASIPPASRMSAEGNRPRRCMGWRSPRPMPPLTKTCLRWHREQQQSTCAKVGSARPTTQRRRAYRGNRLLREARRSRKVWQLLPQGADASNTFSPGRVGGPSYTPGCRLGAGLLQGKQACPGDAHLGDHNRPPAWAASNQTREVGLSLHARSHALSPSSR